MPVGDMDEVELEFHLILRIEEIIARNLLS